MTGGQQRQQQQQRTAAAPHLRVRGVTKRFGAFTALSGVSLDVMPGEFVCFLGPSGCGKTTLLRAIAGLDPQDEGGIELGGRDVSLLPPSARDFGIVFQSYALFPNLRVADNVGYGLASRGVPRAEARRRVEELLALVGLADQGRKYPVQLSGGQQQRVALSRALATSPGLLLLDEPLSALDARVRLRLRDELKSLQRTLGVTTIMVTHDQEEALAIADRVVVMNHGVIDQVGTPEEVYRRPATAFAADFIGTMNLLDGVLVAPGRVRAGGVELACPRTAADGGLPPPGAPVRLGLRPEEVRPVANGHDPAANRVATTVEALHFHGAFGRARLRAPDMGGAVLQADFAANLLEDFSLSPGDDLAVELPPDRLRVFAAAG